jgi:transcriptional regulator with XRE-family HTH domain
MYGAKITAIRIARGYTQEYLAEKLGIQQNVYSKIERDEKIKMDEETLGKIAKTLGVSIEDIKSSTPIIMNFQAATYHGQQNQHSNINDSVIGQLTNQLLIKDSRISHLLEQNQHLQMQLEKLLENKHK